METREGCKYSFEVRGYWDYSKYLFMYVGVISFLIYTHYTLIQRGETSKFIMVFEVLMTVGGLFLAFYPILEIELSEDYFITKLIFNTVSRISYTEIEEINISYGEDLVLRGQKFDEAIWIHKKDNNDILIDIPRKNIELEKHSDFLDSLNFLATKVTTTIRIAPIYKRHIDESIIKAKIEWSDTPKVYKRINEK
ncbi:hypothetical protein [Bernardetia sp.]|uniref:hypothetical protein n=1 Tax=Bernardetia sp. TaxID=1937974 RepID=UPI0025C3C98E|nr:hypothetical protein [Bernardetia sp.]